MIGLSGHPFVLYRLSIRRLEYALKEVRRVYRRGFIKGKDTKEALFCFFSREVHRCFFHADSS
jgi:hypothetical protein